jgi:hypothetical protein
VLYSTFLFLVDGSYGNWTASPCSATCGEGVVIRIRLCDNPPGKYGGNCSKQGPAQEILTCKMNPCQGEIYLYWLLVMIIQFFQKKVGFTMLSNSTWCSTRSYRTNCRYYYHNQSVNEAKRGVFPFEWTKIFLKFQTTSTLRWLVSPLLLLLFLWSS